MDRRVGDTVSGDTVPGGGVATGEPADDSLDGYEPRTGEELTHPIGWSPACRGRDVGSTDRGRATITAYPVLDREFILITLEANSRGSSK